MKKKAGMIDPVQKTLAPDLFDENMKMLPHIREELLSSLSEKISLDKVEKALMTGSLTGYQYNPESDVDISVYIKDPKEEWLGSGKSELVGDISHRRFKTGSNRTYQYYVLPWDENTQRGLQHREYGLYDVKEDKWFNPPRPREEYTDPEYRYRAQLIVARSKSRQFNKLVKRYQDFKIKSKSYTAGRYSNENWNPMIDNYHLRKAQWALKDLVDFASNIYIDRHHRYSSGWGIPRKAKANVIFKLIEYGPNSEIFDEVSKMELPKRIEDIELI